jgi:serine/threonine-protein kinase
MRPVAIDPGRPPTMARPRPPTGTHRTPVAPNRSMFTPAQRALLIAAGVLGALAIVIAAVLLMNWKDKRTPAPPPTVTNTTVIPVTPSPAPAAPAPSPGALPSLTSLDQSPESARTFV